MHEDFQQLVIFIILFAVIIPLVGQYMVMIFQEKPKKIPILSSLERSIYRLCSIDPNHEMSWKEYVKSLLLFNGLGFIFLFLLLLLQGWLPLNPQGFANVKPILAFNIAASFVTNTNWQSYGGENTLTYLSQMLGLTVQNFASAATGNAVLLALIRGLVRKMSDVIGNFWVDVTRTVIYLLVPLSVIFALILVSQGVIQNFKPYVEAITLIGEKQIIPMGPVASQIAIKQIGTNGGGFFNANSSHPFENPTPLSNLLEILAILCIPAASVYMYAKFIQSTKRGLVIFSVMVILWGCGLVVGLFSQSILNPSLGVNPVLEGQETRFGTTSSILWAISTTSTSNGSVNSMHSSLSPLAGGIALFNIMIGEIIFGGVGVGLCGMLMFAILTVFLAGLMVGKTPEYLHKKIEKTEIKWVILAILAPCALILLGSTIATILPSSLESLSHTGPHGLSEILYAFSSASGNNGSAFAGLNANTNFYNLILGVVMILARLAILFPSVAVAGCLAQKKTVAESLGTFYTDKPLFGILLMSVIFIVGALTFFPALSLGPIVEHLLMLEGRTFP